MAAKEPTKVFQIKITLRGSKPPIWRRVMVGNTTTLATFHDIIQRAMGWHNSHLHAFEIEGLNYSVPRPDFMGMDESDDLDANKYTLNDLVRGEGFKFNYVYDFGDSWDHTILVEKVLPAVPGQKLPVCITGKRACPPEDIGGVWGYANFLEAMKDPKHPEHKMYKEWIGSKFDSEAFDKDKVNLYLQR
jgi:hypothetical protein